MTSGARPRIAFVIEQALGHVAYGMALREALAAYDAIEQVWIDVPYEPRGLGRLPIINRNWTLRGSLAARSLLAEAERETPFDALFLHTQTISLFMAGFMKRIPTLLSLDATPANLDELASSYGHSVGGRRAESLKRHLHRRVMKHAAQFTTWSAWAKRSLVEQYGADAARVTVVHPGANLAEFPRPDTKAYSQSGRLQVLFVGGDFERKGGDLLLSVVQQNLRDDCELHVVTARDVAAAEHVHVYRGLRPHSPELLDLYARADVFVLPTRGDCLAVVLGEAMASALPIITTNVGAHAEAVVDGESGYIIGVDDADALGRHLRTLANDRVLLARMGARSRAIGEDRFDMARGARTIAGMLHTLATATPHPAASPTPEQQEQAT